jgi:hypothetical protein
VQKPATHTSASRRDPRIAYEIQVEGHLDPTWARELGGETLALSRNDEKLPMTTLVCAVSDQAGLRGLLCRLWDLNLTIVSVRRAEREE